MGKERRAQQTAASGTKPRAEAGTRVETIIKASDPLPPQPEDHRMKRSLLGKPVRMLVGGRMMTVFLTDWDDTNDTYAGEAHSNRSLDTSDHLPVVRPVQGLRRYPYSERPDYAFQFVLPGDDESVLINIASASIAARQAT